jgi:hypothetical protein
VSALAGAAPQLRPYLPLRAGGQLAELALEAARTRRAGALVRGAPRVLRTSPSPLRTLAAAAAYVAARRRWAQRGQRLWEHDEALRRWLAER